jgi:integrase
MYQDYDQAAAKVMEYLAENNYSTSIVYMQKRCLCLLKAHLQENKVAHSHELALSWLESLDLCRSLSRNYRLALLRLNAALECREITNTKERYEAIQYDKHLVPWCKELLDIFLESASSERKPDCIQGLRVSASRFLCHMSTHGVESASEITHRLIHDYNRDNAHKNQKVKDRHNSRVRILLRHLAERKQVKASIPLVLDRFVLKRLVFLDDLPSDEKCLFGKVPQASQITAEEFHAMAMGLSKSQLARHRYSFTVRKTFTRAWNELFVFLECNGLHYSQEIALCWAGLMRCHTTQWLTFRRSMKIFEQFRHSGGIYPSIVYSYKNDKADELPEWCRKEYRDFITEKHEQGLALSTIDVCRSSCLRFLEYLSNAGLSSWEDISPEVVKSFHLADLHSTPEAKNAYAAKIRFFLKSLGEKEVVPPFLYLALSNEHAPTLNIIEILNGDELKAIYDFLDRAESGIQLRDAAMIILGLRMGIRASDVTGLKLSDISWEKATISIRQQKTGKFIELPIPTMVGNCLYKYIVRGRPSTAARHVFITHRVPYNKLHRCVCAGALNRVLPTAPHGFQITRKTFASRMLVNSTKPETIAEALGHSDNSTVMTYLATDSRSMRKCAISMGCIEYKGDVLS